MKSKVYRGANGVSKIIRAKYVGGSTYSDEWKALSARVKKRDGYRCTKCGKHQNELNALGLQLQVNHIVMVSRGGSDSIHNLKSECELCHSRNFKHGHMRKKRVTGKKKKKAKKSAFYEVTTGRKL